MTLFTPEEVIKKIESGVQFREAELSRLKDMTEMVEHKNVRRLEKLVLLSQLRAVTLMDVMKDLGIKSAGYA